MKKFLYYFGWMVGISIIIYLGATYQTHLREEMSKTMDTTNYLLFSVTFPIVIGLLLSLPKLINRIGQEEKWVFNWIKLLVVGLPSLLVLFIYLFLEQIPESFFSFIPMLILLRNQTILVVTGLVFGYVILDCLEKQEYSGDNE